MPFANQEVIDRWMGGGGWDFETLGAAVAPRCCLLRDETARCGLRCEIWIQIAVLRGVIGSNLGFTRFSRFKITVWRLVGLIQGLHARVLAKRTAGQAMGVEISRAERSMVTCSRIRGP